MPTSINDEEVAEPFGALDQNAFTNPAFVHAHCLRTLIMNARRHVQRGDYLIQQVWRSDGSDDIEATGGRVFDVPVSWTRILDPFPVFRKPHIRYSTAQIRARIDNGARVLVYFAMDAIDRPSALSSSTSYDAARVVSCVGTGSWAWYTSNTLEFTRDPSSMVSVWAVASSSVAFDTATYGTPDSGTLSGASTVGFWDNSATWNQAAFLATPNRITVEMYNADGAIIIPRRTVQAGQASSALLFAQPITRDQAQAANASGVTYRLVMGPATRLGALIVREVSTYV